MAKLDKAIIKANLYKNIIIIFITAELGIVGFMVANLEKFAAFNSVWFVIFWICVGGLIIVPIILLFLFRLFNKTLKDIENE